MCAGRFVLTFQQGFLFQQEITDQKIGMCVGYRQKDTSVLYCVQSTLLFYVGIGDLSMLHFTITIYLKIQFGDKLQCNNCQCYQCLLQGLQQWFIVPGHTPPWSMLICERLGL
eukprot:TRINITY_DN5122_c0_g1_i3.p4 TRINITY_DN5122_c0_g1~~TRINITY_DN5122_c0_g1_i3.p4  ORF type:complete len:113 (-),score=3.00 TRINITY_DN5122_c0_g1_i3:81-419(-)